MRRAWNVIAPLLLGALLAFAVWQGVLNRQQGEAICTLRHDLEHRISQSNDFLDKHPHGAFGFSRAQIEKSINDQSRTIKALAGVSC